MSETTATTDPTTYHHRANAFVGARAYRLTEDALTWQEEGKKLDGVFYDDISEVRLAYVPTRATTNRYRAQVIFRKGGMAELSNMDYVSLANFAEHNDEYVAFLTELHRRLAARGKNVVFRQGNSLTGFILNVALTVFIFASLALAFMLFLSWGGPWVAVAKFVIVLFFLPVLIQYIRKSWPAKYDPLALPTAVLPAAA